MSNANKQVVSLPTRDSVTQFQANTLLGVMGMCLNALTNPMYRYSSTDEEGPKLPGEARIAVENTLIHTCERLDAVLTDSTRWDFKTQDLLESGVIEIQKAQKQLLDVQAEAIKRLDAPHMRYKPTLFRVTSGDWGAMLGDPANLDSALVGIGRSPEEALASFDDLFKGKLPAYMVEWLAIREQTVESGEPTPPFPNKSKETNEQNKNLDPEGPNLSKKSKSRRNESRRDRGPAEPEQDGSGPQS